MLWYAKNPKQWRKRINLSSNKMVDREISFGIWQRSIVETFFVFQQKLKIRTLTIDVNLNWGLTQHALI